MRIAFATTVSRTYLPLARVLMDSVAAHHSDSARYVLVLDDGPGLTADAEILRPFDLIDDHLELTIRQTIYHPIEYATALKPMLLRHLLKDADQVFFIDPDIRLFQPITAAVDLLSSGAGTVLTPHRVSPPVFEDRALYEGLLKSYGTYNTAFVGVTDASLPLLEWWDSRLKRDCLADLRRFEWVDQKVMDLAPSYFEFDLLRDQGYNVAWWNLDERPIRRENGTWYTGPVPLVALHYTGVRPVLKRGGLPQLIHSSRNKASQDPAQLQHIQVLEDNYVADIKRAGYDDYTRGGYGLSATPGGRPLSLGARRGYRQLVLAAEARGDRAPLPDDMSWSPIKRLSRRMLTMYTPGAVMEDARAVPKLQPAVARVQALRRRMDA